MQMIHMCMYGFCRDDGSEILQSTVWVCLHLCWRHICLDEEQSPAAEHHRLKWCGARPAVACTRSLPYHSALVLIESHPSALFETSVSIWTLIFPWRLMSRTVSSFFGVRQIRSVRKLLPRHAVMSLVTSLVLAKLDYCNSVLAGLPMNLLNKIQAVINSAARLVCYSKTAEHITPLLRDLHWLRIRERITFKLCVIAFKCQHNQAPAYLSDQLQQVSQVESRRRLRSSSTSSLVVPATRRSTLVATERFQFPPPEHGTVCRQPSPPLQLYLLSAEP